MIDEYLVRHENHLKDIKSLLQSILQAVSTGVAPNPSSVTTLSSLGVGTGDYLQEFNELKSLLESNEWPIAVDPDLICDESKIGDNQVRAASIVDFMIDQPLSGKKFLDFGCGEGFITAEVADRGAAVSIGYDLKQYPRWGEMRAPSAATPVTFDLTTDWGKVERHAPYDVVFLYDVLDHAVGSQVDILKKIKSVCASGSKIYVRTHPWCSRSATHTYRKLNKAYTHLVFSDIELVRLGLAPSEPIYPVIHPHATYEGWYESAGLRLLPDGKHPYSEEVEDFFERNPVVSKRIRQRWANSNDPKLASGASFPRFQMTIQFVDHVLEV